jgi:hypothetical protein
MAYKASDTAIEQSAKHADLLHPDFVGATPDRVIAEECRKAVTSSG